MSVNKPRIIILADHCVRALLFFIMLLFLGLGTQFSMMETLTRLVVETWW